MGKEEHLDGGIGLRVGKRKGSDPLKEPQGHSGAYDARDRSFQGVNVGRVLDPSRQRVCDRLRQEAQQNNDEDEHWVAYRVPNIAEFRRTAMSQPLALRAGYALPVRS